MQFVTKSHIWIGGVKETRLFALRNYWIIPGIIQNNAIIKKIPLDKICIQMCPFAGRYGSRETHIIAQNMKFSIKDFFIKCDQINRKLSI